MEQPVNLPRLGAGYWISPTNYFFTVTTHIRSVCNNAASFGTTEAALRKVFDRYQEPWCSEMRAREFIILELVASGWIRVRNRIESGADRWSVNMSAIDTDNLRRLCALLRRLYPDGVSYAPVSISSAGGTGESTVDALLHGGPVAGRTFDPDALPRLTYIESPEQMPGTGIPEIRL